MLNTEDIWNKFLEIVKEKINPVSFSTWFKTISIHKMSSDTLTILVPMFLHKATLNNIYYDLIEDTFLKLTGIDFNIEFVTEDELQKEKVTSVEELVVDNYNDNKKDKFETNLIPTLNFDNYVVGDTNRFAKTAALAVAENPGKAYNPLFIYGKSGIGKTHLMHSIGNYIVENTDLKVLYTTSNDFLNDYTKISNTADGKNSFDYANEFKNKYRNIDVLIIDDIQFLVGAEKTQQEFFHTFNDLHMRGKQIIISSDRSPEDLKKLEERLRSRFTWGLPIDIFPPDYELRCRIIKDKIKYLNLANKMTDEAIEYIANNCDTDVRSLEGAINRLVAYTAMIVPEKITLEFVNEALRDYVTKNIYIMNDISNIQKAVADYYGLTIDILKSKKRSNDIAYPRQIAMYLCRMLTDESFPTIGLEFGGRDHSTVIHACDKIDEDLKNNDKLKEIINEIKSKL